MVVFTFLVIFVFIFLYARAKSDEIRQKMIQDIKTDVDGNFEIYTSDANLAHPTLPFPTIHELGIREGSSLERVYNHFTIHRYLKPSDYRFLKIKRSADHIYRLRKMGFTIATQKTSKGNFKQYKLICYKLKK
jgi:hypothetical protein